MPALTSPHRIYTLERPQGPLREPKGVRHTAARRLGTFSPPHHSPTAASVLLFNHRGRARPSSPVFAQRYRRGVSSDWLDSLGVYDAEPGSAAARSARDRILEPARRVLGTTQDITALTIVFQGFVARAQCLHEASVQAIDAGNPHAAFTLLRAYAENAAAVLYAKDHPTLVGHWWDPDGHGIKVGKITNYAASRFGGFKGIYDQLSKFAHPQAIGLLASSRITNEQEATMQWSSAPHFKKAEDQLTAYAWAVELADASRHLLFEFAQTYRLGYFMESPPEAPAALEHNE
jgi:hypothetical protein